jgi:putative Mg2+ transporter-C (MgtC) family protein
MSEFWTNAVEILRLDLLAYLGVAVLLGGAIGLERERRGKAAGLRTNILICTGAALFTQLSIEISRVSQDIAGVVGDPSRIAAQVVTGVGFLGAGTILQARGRITGLTSAATIWMVAAIGMAVGAGHVYEASGATLLVILVLWLLAKLEAGLRRLSMVSTISVEVDLEPERVAEVEELVRMTGLEIRELHTTTQQDRRIVALEVAGPAALHEQIKERLLRTSGAFTLTVEE